MAARDQRDRDLDTPRDSVDVQALSVLASLPIVWSSAPPNRIVNGLADTLVRLLGLNLCYATTSIVDAPFPIEVGRVAGKPEWRRRAADLRRLLPEPMSMGLAPRELRFPHLGLPQTRLCRDFFGHDPARGVVYVGAPRPSFPTPTEWLLFRMVIAHATLALETASHVRDVTRRERYYRDLFEGAPIAMWHQTLVALKRAIVSVHARGIANIREYIAEHPEFIDEALSLVRIVEVNSAALRLFGATHGDELDSLARIAVPESRPALTEIVAAIAAGQPAVAGETTLQRLDGRRLEVIFSVTLPPRLAPMEHVPMSVLDITERKQFEGEREALLRRERDARAEAETSSRLKDEFLAVLSHELRTPLNAILGWTHLLRHVQLDSDAAAGALEKIERNAQMQAQLVDSLLDMSHIWGGKLRLSVAIQDIVSLLGAAIEIVQPAAAAKAVSIEVHNDASAPVHGDATRLQQVLWNLLANAVKFTPPGGRITVDVRHVDGEVEIAVHDTGDGIAPDFRPHIFERFRQASTGASRAYGGLGLGLALVQELVEAHGGRVTAESPGVGQGATFIVRLPGATASYASGD
jgi:PAS domain S-box-containing protein